MTTVNRREMKENLKILFLSNRSPIPINDGHTRRTYHILKGLAERHRVHFVSLYEIPEELDDENLLQLKALCEKVELYPAPSKKAGIQMLVRLVCSLFSSDPYTIWRHYSLKYHNRVKELVAKENYDIIHCDNLPMAYTVRNECSHFRSITDHDVSYLKCLRMAEETDKILLKLFLYYETLKLRNLERRIFKQFNLGIVVSKEDRLRFLKLNSECEIIVIENGVDTVKFTPSATCSDRNETLIWVGGFKHFSNESAIFYFLKDIYPRIKRKLPNVTFDIIGGGMTNRIYKLVSTDLSIRHLGFVDDPLPYIQSAKVFVVPIVSGSGTRLKLLEAMAVGIAAVSTSVGCEGIEGVDGVHFIVSDTPEEFSAAAVKLMTNMEYRSEIEINARKLAEDQYDWSIITAKLNNAYNKII